MQRTKELADGEKVDSKVSSLDTSEGSSGSTSTPSPKGPSESELNTSDASLDQDLFSLDPMGSRHSGFDANLRQPLYVEDADQNSGHQMQIGNEHWKPINTSQRVLPKQTRNFLNGFHTDQVPATKSFGSVRHVNYRESKSAPLVNGHKIWTPKSKPEYEAEGADERETVGREQAEDEDLPDKTKVIRFNQCCTWGWQCSPPACKYETR